MLDVLVIAATRSRTVDILLVAGYVVAVPVIIRAMRQRRRRTTAALAGGRVLELPERTPTPSRPEPVLEEPEIIDAEAELIPEPEHEPEPEPEPVPVAPPPVALAPDPPPLKRPFRQPREEQEEPAAELTAEDVDECQIAVWRGFRKAHFYAAPVLDEGVVDVGIYASPLFRARGDEPQQTDEAVAAYNELRARLDDDDWVLVDKGDAWYSGRFRRGD